jgi:hypothetical protein
MEGTMADPEGKRWTFHTELQIRDARATAIRTVPRIKDSTLFVIAERHF